MNKFVTDLSNKEDDDHEQETSEMQFEEFALKTNVLAFARRSDAKAKPRRRTSTCSSTRTKPICERSWTAIFEPETYSLVARPVSKQLSTLLRHGHLPREEDGAIEFWRLKEYLRIDLVQSQHWSAEMWKSKMAGGGGNKKIFQCCTDPSGQEILYLRALQGHSGRNPIDPSLQANVLIPNNFFEHIYHIGCAVNLHSITKSGVTPGGQILSKSQTVFFTSVDPLSKDRKDPDVIDLDAPRFAWEKQKVWMKHQNTVYWVDIELAQQKGYKFYQTRSNTIILFDTFPAYSIPKAIMMETGEIIYEKVYASPGPPPKISIKDIWRKELDSEVAGRNEDSQQTQPRSKTQLLSTARPVKSKQPSGSLTQEIEKDVLFGCESTNVSTVRPVKSCVPVFVERLDKDQDADENVDTDQISTIRHVSGKSIGLFTQREEIDIDFRVS